MEHGLHFPLLQTLVKEDEVRAFPPETGRGAAKGAQLREKNTQGDEDASPRIVTETGKEGER